MTSERQLHKIRSMLAGARERLESTEAEQSSLKAALNANPSGLGLQERYANVCEALPRLRARVLVLEGQFNAAEQRNLVSKETHP
jgi:hypothetical protein